MPVIAKMMYVALQDVRNCVQILIHLAVPFQGSKEVCNREVDSEVLVVWS